MYSYSVTMYRVASLKYGHITEPTITRYHRLE